MRYGNRPMRDVTSELVEDTVQYFMGMWFSNSEHTTSFIEPKVILCTSNVEKRLRRGRGWITN
jgi:hypothetical protein